MQETHTGLFFQGLSSSSTSCSLHHGVSSLWPLWSSLPPPNPPAHRSAAAACVYSARGRARERARERASEGPAEGTMASFRKTINPAAEHRKSAWGPADTPSTNFTAARHRATTQTRPRTSRKHTQMARCSFPLSFPASLSHPCHPHPPTPPQPPRPPPSPTFTSDIDSHSDSFPSRSPFFSLRLATTQQHWRGWARGEIQPPGWRVREGGVTSSPTFCFSRNFKQISPCVRLL